nr:acyl carrier protein [Candidatus Cloacimonadota bacterium]
MDKFIDILADALEMEITDIKANDKFREYEEWDSLAVLSVIAMIKQNYGITIPRKEFDSLLTVEDLYNYISANKG